MLSTIESPRTVHTFSARNIDREKNNNEFSMNEIKHSYSPKPNSNDRKRPKLNSSSFKKIKSSPKKENKKLTFNNDVKNNIKNNEKEKLDESLISRKNERHYSSKSINKKPIRHVKFKSPCVTEIEVESYKKYNFLNKNKINLSKKKVSCKCEII